MLPGVVSGISFYGNCLGLPNIGGELDFDPCYAGNPLVNALCVGVMRHGDLQVAAASGPGNKVILFGSATGPDGVGGASVLASATFGDARAAATSAKRPSVQVGDPFMEKLLVECCLELFAGGLVSASRTWARPGSPARPPSSPRPAPAACGSGWTRCRCGTRRWGRPRS